MEGRIEISRRLAVLYARMLTELGGADGLAMQGRLGHASRDVYWQIGRRVRERIASLPRDGRLVLDPVDLAVVRAVVPVVLDVASEPDFNITTNFSFDDLRELARLVGMDPEALGSAPETTD